MSGAKSPKGPAEKDTKSGKFKKRTLDVSVLEGMGRVLATNAEVALVLGFTEDGLRKRLLAEPVLRNALERGKAVAKVSLRRKQFELANDGHPTMLIWLGKQVLGQHDTPQEPPRDPSEEISDAELIALLKKNGATVADPLAP